MDILDEKTEELVNMLKVKSDLFKVITCLSQLLVVFYSGWAGLDLMAVLYSAPMQGWYPSH